MENMKNKPFATAIILCIAVVTLSTAYYLVIYLPRIGTQKLLDKNIAQCQQDGERRLEKDKKEFAEVSSVGDITTEYHFSQRRKTCVYYLSYRDGSTSVEGWTRSWSLTDLSTNKLLGSAYEVNMHDKPPEIRTMEAEQLAKFNALKKELFEE